MSDLADVAEVKEAIERVGRAYDYGTLTDGAGVPAVLDAARRWVRMVSEAIEDECLRCGGEGYWDESNPLPGYSPGPPPMTCPYCKGSGRVLVAAVGVEKDSS